MRPGDIVTIRAPFGDATTRVVVSGIIDPDTDTVWDANAQSHTAYSIGYLTIVGDGGDYPSPVDDESAWWMTVGAFRARFTAEEKVRIELAAIDDPSSPMSARSVAAAIRAAEKDAAASRYIDLNDPRTIAGVRSYEAFGLIGPGRADEILMTMPTEKERYCA